MAEGDQPGVPAGEEEGVWAVSDGRAQARPRSEPEWRDDASPLTYSNPFSQEVERVWFDGRVVFAVELGELDVDVASVKVAQEYQVVYDAQLDSGGKPVREPERVPGQYNIYDSVPGMAGYSPLWQFNYVIVPGDYRANSLRSERDCLDSGYRIVKSTVVEN